MFYKMLKMIDLNKINTCFRPDILSLKPYASARDEFRTDENSPARRMIFLDANENSLGGPLDADYSRYPDPQQQRLKNLIATQKALSTGQIFLGNGSDEAIDLLIRACCEPRRDTVLLLPPTYGMYAVQAAIQGARIREVALTPDFEPDLPALRAACDETAKLLFLCSPNNPTGNRFRTADVRTVLSFFPGIVVLDEAYVDFSETASLLPLLAEFPNLVILQTLSKAWGLAGLRIGMAFANPLIIRILNKIKYPYNLDAASVAQAETALMRADRVGEKIVQIRAERERLAARLSALPRVRHVFASEANFLLFRVNDADELYARLCADGVVLRNRSRDLHCENCLRITVGTPQENDRLIQFLKSYK